MTISVEDAKETLGGFVAALTMMFTAASTLIGRTDVGDVDKLKGLAQMMDDYGKTMPQFTEAVSVVSAAAIEFNFGYLWLGLGEIVTGLRQDAASPPVFGPGEPIPPGDGLITLRKSVLLRYADMTDAMLKVVGKAVPPDTRLPP